MLLAVQNAGCMECFIPKKYKDERTYEVEWDKLEN